jgi:hypothetical protein
VLIANSQETNFVDANFSPGTAYRITAVNGIGEGPYCSDFVPTAGPVPKACELPGILAVNDILTDGQNNDFGANQPPDPSVNIRQMFVSEVYSGKLVFTVNLGISSLPTPPPQSQWYIIFTKLHPNSDFDRNWVGMKTDAQGAITYEYGDFGVGLDPLNPNPNANMAVKIGNADSGSYNPATGELKITISTSKLENIQIGQSLTNLVVRTFLTKDPTEAKATQTAADTTDPGHYDLVGNAACLQSAPLITIVSRKDHTGVGPFDVNLFPNTAMGVECRQGQGTSHDQHQVVFTFANPLVNVATANVTGTKGSPAVDASSGINPNEPREYIVKLTGVQDAQKLTITLTGITDTVGNNTATLSVDMGVLMGDVNVSHVVTSGDTNLCKAQALQPLTSDNFRDDINVSGTITTGDVNLIKQNALSSLP